MFSFAVEDICKNRNPPARPVINCYGLLIRRFNRLARRRSLACHRWRSFKVAAKEE
jgi:hypothetical protein